MRHRLNHLIELLKAGEAYVAEEDSDRWKLAKMYSPVSLLGDNSAEIDYDKQYERVKLIIAQKTNLDIKSLTVFQYYAYLEAVKEQADEEQKAAKRIKK